MRLGDFDHGGQIEATVHRIFYMQLIKTRESPGLDELDEELLRQAAENQTAILLLTSYWKHRGALTPTQEAGFATATKIRDACLKGLRISNPYDESAN
jgi:hypothetical protein